MAKISIFGIGYVGVVAAACLARDGHNVVAVDVDPAKVDAIQNGKSPIVEKGLPALIAAAVADGKLTATSNAMEAVAQTDISFVCVGTPSAPDGSVGLVYVEAACRDIGAAIAAKQSFHSVVIRSTVVPLTCETVCIPALEAASGKSAGTDFGVGYYPEFLREGTAIEDYDDPGLIVFGSLDDTTRGHLAAINAELPCVINQVDLRTAEMIKYTSNTWRAVKVTFANEIGNIAKSNGIDGQKVMQILCSDDKVSMSPYFMRPGFAFGGSCLPKDVRALRQLAKDRDVAAPLLNAVLAANEAQIDRAQNMIAVSGAKSVGMVGISFKPGTDDLRESPLAELASRLIADGISVNVYDPFVHEAYAEQMSAAGRGNSVIPDLSERLISKIDDLIEGADAIVIGNLYEDAIPSLRAMSETTPIVDLTRLTPGKVSKGAYAGICW